MPTIVGGLLIISCFVTACCCYYGGQKANDLRIVLTRKYKEKQAAAKKNEIHTMPDGEDRS